MFPACYGLTFSEFISDFNNSGVYIFELVILLNADLFIINNAEVRTPVTYQLFKFSIIFCMHYHIQQHITYHI